MHYREDLWQRNWAPINPFAKRLSANEFENDVVGVAHQLEVVDLDEVGMAGSRHHLGLLQEALQRDGVGGRRLDELLDRDLSAQARLLREVHGAHAAAA